MCLSKAALGLILYAVVNWTDYDNICQDTIEHNSLATLQKLHICIIWLKCSWGHHHCDLHLELPSCDFHLGQGKDKVMVPLSIAEKPGKPDVPDIAKMTPKFAQLAWKPPAEDGGSKIFNYVIEYRQDGDFKWTRANEDDTVWGD